jgi:hypothetical protein
MESETPRHPRRELEQQRPVEGARGQSRLERCVLSELLPWVSLRAAGGGAVTGFCGGSWQDSYPWVRVNKRITSDAFNLYEDLGFRFTRRETGP